MLYNSGRDITPTSFKNHWIIPEYSEKHQEWCQESWPKTATMILVTTAKTLAYGEYSIWSKVVSLESFQENMAGIVVSKLLTFAGGKIG